MLLLLSAIVLVLLSGYGVLAPMIIRDVIGNGDIYVYPDKVDIQLKSNSTDIHFKGEFFITRNNIDAYIHKTFYRIYYRNKPILGITLSDMQTFVSKRTDLNFRTQLVIFNPVLINEMILDAQNGNNSDVIMQGYMGVSVFNVPAYQNVFVERYLLIQNTNIQTQLQQLVDGTFESSSIDPTLQEYPKPVFPPLNAPTIHSITLYRKSNKIGLKLHFEWFQEFIAIYMKEFRLNINLGHTVIGGIFVENLKLYNGNVDEEILFGLFFNSGNQVQQAFQHAFTTLLQDLTVNIGVSGPITIRSNESIDWLYNSTRSLDINLHLDLPSIVNRLPISLPRVPKSLLNVDQMHLFIKLKTVGKSLHILLDLKLPKSFPSLPKISTLLGVQLSIKYIHDLIQIQLDKFSIISNNVQLSTVIHMYNQPADLHDLFNRFNGNVVNKNKLYLHKFQFLPDCPDCSVFNKLDLAIDPPIINTSQYIKFATNVLSNSDLSFKLKRLSIRQLKNTFTVNAAVKLNMKLPVDIFIGYLSAKIQLNDWDAISIVFNNLRVDSKFVKIEVSIVVYDNPSYSSIINNILNSNPISDNISLSSVLIGESSSEYTELFDKLNIKLPLSVLLKSLPLNGFDLNISHIFTPTSVNINIRDVFHLVLISNVNIPFDCEFYVQIDPIHLIINNIDIYLDKITLSDSVKLDVKIKFKDSSSISELISSLLEHNFDAHVSLSIGTVGLLKNAHLMFRIPSFSVDLADVFDLSNFVNNPISINSIRNIDLIQHGSTISVHISANVFLNVPVTLFVSKLSTSLRINGVKVVSIDVDTISISPGSNNLDVKCLLLFHECPNCGLKAISDIRSIGIQDLILGSITQLYTVVVDLDSPNISNFPRIPVPNVAIPKISSFYPIHKLHLSSVDSTINLQLRINNPFRFLTIHAQSINLDAVLNNNQFVNINLKSLIVDDFVYVDVSTTFSDISSDVRLLYDYITTSGAPGVDFKVRNIIIDSITLFGGLSISIPIPSNMIDPSTAIAAIADSSTDLDLSSLVSSWNITELDDSSISAMIRVILPNYVAIDSRASVTFRIHRIKLFVIDLHVHNSIVNINVKINDESVVLHDVGDIVTSIINNMDISTSVDVCNMIVGNIHAFELINVELPLNAIKTVKAPTAIDLTSLFSNSSISSVNQHANTLIIGTSIVLPANVNVDLFINSARVSVKFTSGDLRLEVPSININELYDTDVQLGVRNLEIWNNLGKFKLNNNIPISAKKELTSKAGAIKHVEEFINSTETSNSAITVDYLDIKQVSSTINVICIAKLPIDTKIQHIEIGVRINEQFIALITIKTDVSIDVQLMFKPISDLPLSLILGIEHVAIGNSVIYIKTDIDASSISLPQLPSIRIKHMPSIDAVKSFDITNSNNGVHVLSTVNVSKLVLNIEGMQITGGTSDASTIVKFNSRASLNSLSVDLNLYSNVDSDNIVDLYGLFNNKIKSVFVGSISIGSLIYTINSSFKIPAVQFPTMKLPNISGKLDDMNTSRINVNKKNIELDAFITASGLPFEVNVNMNNIHVEIQLLLQQVLVIEIPQLKVANNRLHLMAELELSNVSVELQELISTEVHLLINKGTTFKSLNINVININILGFNLLATTRIPITLPLIKVPALPELPELELNRINLQTLGGNKIAINAQALIHKLKLPVHVHLDGVGLDIDLMDSPLISAELKGDYIDRIDGFAAIQLRHNILAINRIIAKILSKRELNEYVHIGIRLSSNILDLVKIKLELFDIVKTGNSSIQLNDYITNVVGGIEQEGIRLDINTKIDYVETNIKQLNTQVRKQNDGIFDVSMEINMPELSVIIKPKMEALKVHMNQIYRRMKLGVDIMQDISINGFHIQGIDVFNEIEINELPEVEYEEGILKCRLHTLNPIKLIKDPGIGTDVLFKLAELPIDVEFDFNTLQFDVLDYKHYNNTLGYKESMERERQHVNELLYPEHIPAIGGYDESEFVQNCKHDDHLKYYNVNSGLIFFIRWISNPLGAGKGLINMKRRKLLRNFKIKQNGVEISWFGELLTKTDVYVHVNFDKFPEFRKNPRPDR
eukprot:NODE_419_length_8955_cov_0.206527.p1 type:complete len:2069 gc:universal NODE_419_length_8955_cov_0.206527:6824-618(-)